VQAFAVRTQGAWTERDADQLLARLRRRGLVGSDADLDLALRRARSWFAAFPVHLFVCGGQPCRERSRDFASLTGALERFAHDESRAASITECQGPCKQAPVATLRVGEPCAMFAQVHDACDWEAVLDYAERATRARSLLVDPGNAQPFLFDPVHEPERVSVPLRKLGFLVGHFSGQGRYADRPGSFHKEVIGSWEAGGRFIGLRMAVTYPLADGRKDVHQALVLVGFNAAAYRYEARAYTDSGTTHDYTLTVDGEQAVFDDRPPGHGARVTRARKVLTPRPDGYDEILEIQADAEPFQTYSTVELRQVLRRA
jgi:hypothetical protein